MPKATAKREKRCSPEPPPNGETPATAQRAESTNCRYDLHLAPKRQNAHTRDAGQQREHHVTQCGITDRERVLLTATESECG